MSIYEDILREIRIANRIKLAKDLLNANVISDKDYSYRIREIADEYGDSDHNSIVGEKTYDILKDFDSGFTAMVSDWKAKHAKPKKSDPEINVFVTCENHDLSSVYIDEEAYKEVWGDTHICG